MRDGSGSQQRHLVRSRTSTEKIQNAWPREDLQHFYRTISLGNIACTAMYAGIMKGVYEIIKKWTTGRIVAGKLLKEPSKNIIEIKKSIVCGREAGF